MKKAGVFQFVAGVIVGALIFGSTAAFAAGVMAQPKTADVVIDGWGIDLKGYIIDGSHYFQLRDISHNLRLGKKDFGIVWDGANNRVLVDTSRGYDPEETMAAPEQTPPEPQAPQMSISEMKQELIALTNAERKKAGLPELAELPALMGTAQLKADDMRINRYYGHNSPVYGMPGDMIKAAIPSARSAAENIASWTKTPQEVITGLMDSPGHRANILSAKYTHIGIGIIEGADGGYWWVQHFVGI